MGSLDSKKKNNCDCLSVSVIGHCPEKSQGDHHSKQKYFDSQDSEIFSVEEHHEAVNDDDSTDLIHSSSRDSSSLTLESK